MTRRRVPAELLLVVGLMLMVVAAGIWALETTATNVRRISATADALLKTEPVHTSFAKKVAAALTAPTGEPTQGDPEAALAAALIVGDRAVDRKPFERAFEESLAGVHAHVFDRATGAIVLDPQLVGQAVAQATGNEAVPIGVSMDGDAFPNLHDSNMRAKTAAPLLGALGLIFMLFGLALSAHRPRALMRIGRWSLVSGFVAMIFFWVLPTVLLEPIGGWPGVIGIVIGSGDWLVLPAAVLALAGALMIVAGHQWEGVEARRALAVIPHAPGRHVDTNWHSPA